MNVTCVSLTSHRMVNSNGVVVTVIHVHALYINMCHVLASTFHRVVGNT